MKPNLATQWIATVSVVLLTFIAAPLSRADEPTADKPTEGEPLIYAHQFSIESKTLGETRQYMVVRPKNYEKTRRTYPVLYLLDGGAHVLHTAGVVEFLANNGNIPNMIIVAIPNTDRTRDLTPTTQTESDQERFPTSGGADNFLKFIREELKPEIESRYRVNDYNILVGHSFGGLFAIHAMVNQPGTFDAYLAISPSLWWDDQALVQQAKDQLVHFADDKCQLYMTLGNEGGMMRAGFFNFTGVMEQFAGANRRWKHQNMDAETHGSVPHRSTYDGLEYLFADWKVKSAPELYRVGGLTLVQQRIERSRDWFGGLVDVNATFDAIVDALLQGDDLEACRALLDQLRDQYVPLPRHWFTLAEQYAEQGNQDASSECYCETLRLQPSHEEAQAALEELGVSQTGVNKPMVVPAELAEQLIGTFAVAPEDDLIHIRRDGDELTVQVNDNPVEGLRRIDESRLYFTKSDIEIEFVVPMPEGEAPAEAQQKIDSLRLLLPRDEVMAHRLSD